MASKYIYPKSIKRAYDEKPNPKGIGCHGTYQIVKNVAALKDNTASVAYWGDYTPQTTGKYKGVLRAYPNTITTFSGSNFKSSIAFITFLINIPCPQPAHQICGSLFIRIYLLINSLAILLPLYYLYDFLR